MKKACLFSPLALIAGAALATATEAATFAVDISWWDNKTDWSTVYSPYWGAVRLDNGYSGYVEGTVSLPHAGTWEILLRGATDETYYNAQDSLKAYIDGALVFEENNTHPTGTNRVFEYAWTVTGDSFTYRFDFTSKASEYWSHMLMYKGQATLVPLPAAAWLFGSGLVGLVAVARRRHH